jgi:tetratricopeptide (TPR) repeat protein
MPLARTLPRTLLLLASVFVFGTAQADDLKEIAQLANQGQHTIALERVNTYLNANPKDVQAQFIKGVILAELNRRDEAIKIFADITSKNPNLPEPHNNLAVLYAEKGEYDQARKALENAIKTHPSYATAHENLGDIYARMASEAYDKALQLDSGNTRAQNKLALIRDLFSSTKKPVMAASRPANTAGAPGSSAAKPGATAAAPVQTTVPQATSADASEDIKAAVYRWAKAWSDQDVDAYLASYSSSFKTPKGESRSAWESLRRSRITTPKSIKVDISDLKISMDSNTQGTGKTLVMINVNGQWLIEEEIAQR